MFFLISYSCHFFDLMRLITGREANLSRMKTMAQRGLNYHDEPPVPVSGSDDDDEGDDFVPIIDAAYVTLPFQSNDKVKAMGCLELCMYADGSRHQEEIIVTGTKGRLEAYLPENKVYSFQRPSVNQWTNRSEPPPLSSIIRNVYDCSDVCEVHGIDHDQDSSPIPTHGGYHYSSTAVEWYKLLEGMQQYQQTGIWNPLVSLEDGLRAVEMGLQATESIVNEE
jgi:myo-inositol 2-dehydrogenase / D-chiro-inositol 1-dehydrogenase